MTKTTTLDVTLKVSGMKCGGCENNVEGKLKEIDGVLNVDAVHKEDIVTIEYEESKTSLDEIKSLITDAGFTVEEEL